MIIIPMITIAGGLVLDSAVEFLGYYGGAVNNTSIAGVDFGTAESTPNTKSIIVIFVTQNVTSGTMSSVTIGGVAATVEHHSLVVHPSDDVFGKMAFDVVVADVNSTSGTLAWSDTYSASAGTQAYVFKAVNVDVATPTQITSATGLGSDDRDATTIDIVAEGVIVGVGLYKRAGSPTSSFSNMTEVYAETGPGGKSVGADRFATAQTNRVITFIVTGGDGSDIEYLNTIYASFPPL